MISTAVEHVYLNYGRGNQYPLGHVSVVEMQKHLAAKQFASGSMAPKIEAALDFLGHGGQEVIITDPDHLAAALAGRAGTHVTP